MPFFINIHPDPHDYFRYTKEALERIFSELDIDIIRIETVGRGPFAVHYNNIVLSIPRIVRVLLFPLAYGIDQIFLYFRPNMKERYPLGYMFEVRKKK